MAVEAESLLCDIEAAAPLGLIANELIAGCFHQVSGSAVAEQCLIKVLLRHHQDAGVDELAVSITAAGENCQPTTDLLHPSDIVNVLTEQISGELALDRTGSPTIRLTVPDGCFTIRLDGSPT
ncbi:hypothetical protein [Skermanella aerolata]|uniref:hypothetical protein n=1 Tax=Skermanella aerolata TaxID=393310 RepID=UPI0005C84105|nr:hypothetical protein [Skermanella aerolata]KJB90552.1 hypothetical protein N826_38850 [Skermanella aerolata KACC 11604]